MKHMILPIEIINKSAFNLRYSNSEKDKLKKKEKKISSAFPQIINQEEEQQIEEIIINDNLHLKPFDIFRAYYLRQQGNTTKKNEAVFPYFKN